MHIGMVSKLDSFFSRSLEERLEAWTFSGTSPRHLTVTMPQIPLTQAKVCTPARPSPVYSAHIGEGTEVG